MKKRNFTSLKLNKKSISNLQSGNVLGGAISIFSCPTVRNCKSVHIDCHTTDPGEIGPCTECER
ncbi:hypothetical protein [uncultured Kordia sp.]|uniref:hypothetical protein n=1 Tax=uncultured Kordia sp. TaxID=507699 RepID=UPI002612A5D4|nr:hypothetical protein [uncultured Kordia sp.]